MFVLVAMVSKITNAKHNLTLILKWWRLFQEGHYCSIIFSKMYIPETLPVVTLLAFVSSTMSMNTSVSPTPNAITTSSISSGMMTNSLSPPSSWSQSTMAGGGGVQDGTITSLTPMASHLSSVSVPTSYVKWQNWTNMHDCNAACCDHDGPVMEQTRSCSIIIPSSNLTKCENYGVLRRDVECKHACECDMRNAGDLRAAPVFSTIMASLLICTA
ncbi:uncharacterized protein [Montipora capricornis]|uniref:uncharacterized protein n=1 Tax=Montipora foliosa TaxID=591990 RepID=UPI0035F13AF5